MKSWTIAAASMLSLSAAMVATAASAQQSLVDLAQAGDREAVLAAAAVRGADLDAAAPDGSTALHWATYQVDHELVRALLDAGANADVTNLYGSTPLTEAVKLGDVELVRMLLDAGADADSPNQDNQTALMLASNIGSLEIAEMLIDAGADVNAVETFRGQTALMWAAAENHPDVAELLIENGADVSMRARHDDWERQMTSEPRAQYRPTGGLTALLFAARSGCYRCAVAIVDAGADVNQPNPDGITPLLNALDNKSFDIAMYLLDHGANNSAWDMYGRTPLYLAVDMNSFNPPVRPGAPAGGGSGAFGGYPEPALEAREAEVTAMDVVNRLLAEGVDVNHQLTQMRPNGPARGRFTDFMMRGGTGPLMIATLSYDNEAIQALLAHGAEVDLPNVFQITPLMAAAGVSGTTRVGAAPRGDAQARAISTIDILLAAGADINARITDSHTRTARLEAYVQGRDREGQTAIFGAAGLGWNRVVEHLIAQGADPAVADAAGGTPLDEAQRALEAAENTGESPTAGANGGRDLESLRANVAVLEAATGVKATPSADADAGTDVAAAP